MPTRRFLFLTYAAVASLVAASVLGREVPQTPVLFVPGYAASLPRSGEFESFTFHRGVPPPSLELSASYALLVRSLKSAGYVEGKTFFGAVFDWRMAAARADQKRNGLLDRVTAASITSGDYSYAINYLGYWLDQAVQANPGLEYVDIVTHSTGGILARAYIQSAAYGAAYVDANGVARHLPKVRYLILGACPNEGTVHSWRPWHGDFQDVLNGFIPTTEIEARFCAQAFAYVSSGGRLPGPDYAITRFSILKPDQDGRMLPDETTFFRLYDPMRQTLMPTDDFLLRDGATALGNINDEPGLRSDLLLDLNAASSPGHNPWLDRIGTGAGGGGAISTYATGAREKTKLRDFVVPGLVNKNPFVSTLVQIDELPAGEGDYLPLLDLIEKLKPTVVPVTESIFPRLGNAEVAEQLGGDGNAPFVSYRSTFEGDPRMRLVQWGNGPVPAGTNHAVRWNQRTGYPVYHVVFFYNPDVRKFVVRTLTGANPPAGPAITRRELRDLKSFLQGKSK